MIKDRRKMNPQIEIDLSGPEGNAFVLMAYAAKLGKRIYGPEKTEGILEEMRLSTYELLLLTFDKYFGNFVTLYRDGGEPTSWMDT